MLDLKYVLANLEKVRETLALRNAELPVAKLSALDRDRREAITEADQLKAERNESSKAIGLLMKEKKGDEAASMRERVRTIGERIRALDEAVKRAEGELEEILLSVPNLPASDVPVGKDESDNRVERTWGECPTFDFEPRDHVEVGEMNQMLDFESAAKITGARFVVLTGLGARLERALAQFMLDMHVTRSGYTEVIPPFIINRESLQGTGNLPKFEQDLFRFVEPENWYLIPTAEVPLTNLKAGEILDAGVLPLKYVAYTPCFRSEAGSYGRDVRGMIRQHQFGKVELVSITDQESSFQVLEELTGHAESILRALGLHYRVVTLSTGDLGFSATKTYDLEVWLPSQNAFREISSCSNCGDYQARRAKIRYRPAGGGKPLYAHTLNGSGLAVGRTMIAMMEQYQNEDGTFDIPEVLRPYLEPRI